MAPNRRKASKSRVTISNDSPTLGTPFDLPDSRINFETLRGNLLELRISPRGEYFLRVHVTVMTGLAFVLACVLAVTTCCGVVLHDPETLHRVTDVLHIWVQHLSSA